MASVTDTQIARLKARAGDPDRRNDTPPTARGRTVTVGNLSLAGLDLGALLSGRFEAPRDTAITPVPASAEAIARAEAALGFALPDDLRRVYAEVGDGGFGPGAGLIPLEQMVETYRALIANPPGQRGQRWPEKLLPITATEPGHDCIEIGTGRIVLWDEEELADGPSDKVWKRSFKPAAPDLASWLDEWLGTPSPEERMRAQMQDAMVNGMRQTLAVWRAKTPQERAAYGLPETGWEEVMFGHLGMDLSKL